MEKQFTYKNKEMKMTTYIILAMLAFDIPIHIFLWKKLDPPWNEVTSLTLFALEFLVIWGFTSILRTRHRITDRELILHFGLMLRKTPVPFDKIVSCERYHGTPPHLQFGPLFEQDEQDPNLLYMMTSRERDQLLLLEVAEECAIRTTRKKPQATKILLNVNEAELFLQTLLPHLSVAETQQKEHAPFAAEPVQPAAPADAGDAGPAVRRVRERVLDDSKIAIKIADLSKSYGDFHAVKGINLQIRAGEVIGFLGSNGAGKTTTIKMMTGQLLPTAGQIEISGHSVLTARSQALQQIGYVPDVPVLYDGLTARQMLWYIGGLYGVPHAECVQRSDELLGLLGLDAFHDRMVGTFSLGMKRKIAIAAALMHRPQVLVLDEVTNGLDPKAARDVKDYIARQAEQGTTVFITTHILDVVEELADRIVIVDRGEMLAIGTLEELRAGLGLPHANMERIFLETTARHQEREAVPV